MSAKNKHQRTKDRGTGDAIAAYLRANQEADVYVQSLCVLEGRMYFDSAAYAKRAEELAISARIPIEVFHPEFAALEREASNRTLTSLI